MDVAEDVPFFLDADRGDDGPETDPSDVKGGTDVMDAPDDSSIDTRRRRCG
ncbi:MAG: hypothetical protein ACJAYU_001721 [Bradymonadia bacterium]|jgi:hypothetical protein